MQRFIEFLFANPLVAIVLLGWLVGLAGKMLKGAADQSKGKKPATRSGRQQGQRVQPQGQRVQPQGQRAQPQAPTGGPASPMAAPQAGRRGPSPEEVAAEMRRILGMDSPKASKAPPAAAPPQVARPALRRAAASPSQPVLSQPVSSQPVPERRGAPLGADLPSVKAEERAFKDAVARDQAISVFSESGTRVNPGLGERIQDRRGPMSGTVGQTVLGGLGGRTRAKAKVGRGPMRGSRLVDVRDMARAIVMREILDPPVGMRDLR